MKNIELVKTTLQFLKDIGVADVMVCAGARNAPLVQGLEYENFQLTSYFEERSAAFYGLGLSRSTQKPVAIITTSGTAAVELFPAVIEAYYQNIPLILITADRPRSYRGSGAPQAIEQAGLFQKYVESSVDWDVSETDFSLNYSATKPVHLNLCFDEPLIDGDYPIAILKKKIHVQKPIQKMTASALPVLKNPLVIVSELHSGDRETVFNFLKKSGAVFYAEFLSGFLNHPDLKEQQIVHFEGLGDSLIDQFQSVIRVGGVPTHRFWRDLEGKYKNIPVLSFSRKNFSGLARTSQVFDLPLLSDFGLQYTEQFLKTELHKRDQVLAQAKLDLLKKYPLSEPAMIQQLSQVIKQEPLYIGNSLPIREWDLFSSTPQGEQQVFAHRGANGIDGQVSGYLGWSHSKNISWSLIGDLTALYDLSALGLSEKSSIAQKRLVIMNNSGGQIFNRLFKNKKYLNPQSVDFSAWAKLWGWGYQLMTTSSEFNQLSSLSGHEMLIELRPDPEQTAAFWSEWDQQCRR